MKKKLLAVAMFTMGLVSAFAQTQYNTTSYFQFNTNYGYLQIGPQNGGWAHIYTDRPAVIFNKPVYAIGGIFSSYNTDNLYLQTGGTTRMTIQNSTGNIGIGSTDLSQKLNIGGDVSIQNGGLSITKGSNVLDFKFDDTYGAGNVPSIFIPNDGGFNFYNQSFYQGGNLGRYGQINVGGLGIFDSNRNYLAGITGDGEFFIKYNNTTVTKLFNNGNATFAGKLTAKELELKLNVWADYVFNKDYKLMPLNQLGSYISQHSHLPNIPSTAEVMEKNVNVGEMQAKLLEKVEELTLYILEQEKRIKSLEDANKNLQKK